MLTAAAHFREAGSGSAVVCLHASASSSGQWRPLMEQFAADFRVLAADLYGCGKSPPWPQERPLWIEDQLALLEPVFQAAGEHFHLVGHSYGGAIALKAALERPQQVRSLVLYEPVLFSVLLQEAPQSAAAAEIRSVAEDTVRLEGEPAARRFIDYWMGEGTWAATPASRRAALTGAVRLQKPEWHSALHDPTPLAAYRSLLQPVLLVTGGASTAAARAVADFLARTLPAVTVEELAGARHMAPVTHPQDVNPRIARFLRGQM